MCGRVGFIDDKHFLAECKKIFAHIQQENDCPILNYNIAPSMPMAALLNNSTYQNVRFDLISHWAKDAKFQPINARAETIVEKPSFKFSFRQRRCLIPVNGFYEWQKINKHKVRYWVHSTDTDFFALAGIYDVWHDAVNNVDITSAAIITTTPNECMKEIHYRMPVILTPEDWKLWLDSAVDEPEAVSPLLVPYVNNLMEAYRVSTRVNSPANNDADLIVPAAKKHSFKRTLRQHCYLLT